jgi:hypothetical protein
MTTSSSHFSLGSKALSSDGHPVTIVGLYSEDGVEFAEITYDDGFLPGPVGGRLAGTEDAPTWEHRTRDGKVVRSGGDYYNEADWIVERGLQPIPLYSEVERADVPTGSFRYGQLAATEGLDVEPESWAVATEAAHFEGDSTTEFSIVLVAHFLFSDEREARETAERLAVGGKVGPVHLIRPAALYEVETGVKGATRITTRRYATEEEATARAKRWAASNSIGSYWAEVKLGERVLARFNLA